jgi:inhibitor of KinA sporulation pathway (predicted exonuclease)
MTLKNELVVVDLEATSNRVHADERVPVQTNEFIIEIGAVLLDRSLRIVDTFERLVRPEAAVTPFITELTSITPEMVAGRPLWSAVAPEFEAWVAAHCRSLRGARLCAWGTYFDIPLLRRCYAHYGLPFPFSGTCFDIKTWAMLWLALSGRRSDRLTVASVAATMAIAPEGPYHRALTDALAEARIAQRVFSDLDGGVFLPAAAGQPAAHVKLVRGTP